MYKACLILIILLLPVNAFAGGDVYIGKYAAPIIVTPQGISPKFYAGVTVDKTFFDRVTPSVSIETQMRDQDTNGAFFPMTVKYDVGIRLDVWDGLYIKGNRMCKHTVDYVGLTEEYWSLQAGYRW